MNKDVFYAFKGCHVQESYIIKVFTWKQYIIHFMITCMFTRIIYRIHDQKVKINTILDLMKRLIENSLSYEESCTKLLIILRELYKTLDHMKIIVQNSRSFEDNCTEL